jgi:membrane protease YdiL (CAAX protease family)
MRIFVFFVLTFLLSWSCFAGAAFVGGGTLSPPSGIAVPAYAIFLLGVFAPALVAIAITARCDGRDGVVALLGQIANYPRQIKWYLFAVTYMAAIKLAAAALHRIATGTWPSFGRLPLFLMMIAILVSTPVQAGEEIGWRGYALPRLTAKFGLGRASIVIGIIWACWHLPLFLIPGSDTYHQSLGTSVLGVTAVSVAMAWLYWRTNGSLLLTMLMHAAINNTTMIVPSSTLPMTTPFTFSASTVGWFTVALLWVGAAYFLFRMRSGKLRTTQEMRG